MSDTFLLGALMGFAGGFLDAYTYLVRGHVFAYAQTGNMVLLAMNAAAGDWWKAASYLFPIFAFVLGVLAAELVRSRFRSRPRIHWRQIIVVAEIAVLLGTVALPESLNMVATVAISFLSAMQVEAFRKVNGNAFASTMCTGNLRSGTELLYHFLRVRDRGLLRRSLQYYGVILFFILGAASGSLLTSWWGRLTALGGALLLAVAFCAMAAFDHMDTETGDRSE